MGGWKSMKLKFDLKSSVKTVEWNQWLKYDSDLPVPTEEETHTNNFIHVFRGEFFLWFSELNTKLNQQEEQGSVKRVKWNFTFAFAFAFADLSFL